MCCSKVILKTWHNLQRKTVAEGVETPAQMTLLRGLGSNLAQGLGISPPTDACHTRESMRMGI